MADDSSDTEAMLAAFARWSAAARVQDHAAGRARQRWMRQQASEATTWSGILLDLAEAHTPATVLTAQRHYSGRLVGVGADLCVLESSRETTVIALPRIVALRPDPAAAVAPWPASDNRPAHLRLTFRDALDAMAADLAPVHIALCGAEALSGELMSAGEDVITLRLPGSPLRAAYLPIAGVEAFSPR